MTPKLPKTTRMPRSMPMLEKLGPLYSNVHIWSGKIREAFAPKP